MSGLRDHLVAIAVALLAFTGSSVHADWILVDDFESFSTRPGTLDGVNGWVETSGSNLGSDFKVDPDPDVSGNQALRVIRDTHNQDSAAFKVLPASIPFGTTGTLFFRTRNFIDPAVPNRPNTQGEPVPGTNVGGDLPAGLSDRLAPAGYGDYETYLITNNGNVLGRNNGGNTDFGDYSADTWFNVWIVAKTDTQEADYYTSVGNGAAQYIGTGGFRNDRMLDLVSFQIRTGFGQGFAGYLDDIYVNPMGAVLANPTVPEPTTCFLMASSLGVWMAIARKRNAI